MQLIGINHRCECVCEEVGRYNLIMPSSRAACVMAFVSFPVAELSLDKEACNDIDAAAAVAVPAATDGMAEAAELLVAYRESAVPASSPLAVTDASAGSYTSKRRICTATPKKPASARPMRDSRGCVAVGGGFLVAAPASMDQAGLLYNTQAGGASTHGMCG